MGRPIGRPRTHCDWHGVKEKLLPSTPAASGCHLYDCTEEKALGKVAPLLCDLSMTPARVYAVPARPLGRAVLAAVQSVQAGGDLAVRVEFHDEAGDRLQAVLPFHLAITPPAGGAAAPRAGNVGRAGPPAAPQQETPGAPGAGSWSYSLDALAFFSSASSSATFFSRSAIVFFCAAFSVVSDVTLAWAAFASASALVAFA